MRRKVRERPRLDAHVHSDDLAVAREGQTVAASRAPTNGSLASRMGSRRTHARSFRLSRHSSKKVCRTQHGGWRSDVPESSAAVGSVHGQQVAIVRAPANSINRMRLLGTVGSAFLRLDHTGCYERSCARAGRHVVQA
eukprot:6200689-Pleurochrysis_carterae.AAC.3